MKLGRIESRFKTFIISVSTNNLDKELNEFIHDKSKCVVNQPNIKLFFGDGIVTILYDKFIECDGNMFTDEL